ncbi:bifunctional (p)ppGpp synthetase/guanosine-3',5'-bis(diphosphate) 3'-pyrophosphohydrolase [Devosia sp. XJ19-1]|uniref:GTP pyrophosphokinase rsh n=1 Tax=Devosia ureilytica TaxID=2952754 RepID=A0A9Q4AKY0_9HYPH|nr:bifunctional (p)ppGpp synthetase/guanosine-3',5'-bis(diphosphate) 3'-pyrophosphohydrolase [Devosia ureilytica]MCP8882528.1 bifunctional (p)ppGpp synthetase/guanosine-3',5'-bis(diphosphate) 3'-pyrophosphohydrolase [Devosia ureilytica]MCP8885585.1 bifunctional (p)ppGpp synthetase/guanosine-3',5'-bis(diphosphate) 3'-pyrophosphohydrolase [Devosia ureilytica]
MMRQYELVERVQAYNPNADEQLLNKAYVYAMQKHGSQKRASGDPYFNHPLEVAAILTELKLDDASIAVGLLHDTIEDTDATRAEIDQLFGGEIGTIVDGLTKIDRLNLVSREEAQAENLRKLLLAISQDVRVLLVKLADRLHNMRTLQFMAPEKQRRIAQETMDIYAPLAGRMGMQDMRNELEDLSFRILQPDHYAAIIARLEQIQEDNRETIDTITAELTERLAEAGIAARVKARVKSPYSIFSKIERKSIAMEQLSDMIGFRVVVGSPEECYRTVGLVHTTWKVVPGRFKDYISVPKHNDYQSIHTTIVGPSRQRVELQIRTEDMDRVAEFGIAAHALYKDGASANLGRIEMESHAYGSLRQTISHLTSGISTEDFLEYTKLELFQDQVFCFTPRGRLIALPRGATPIDFAYSLHTDIGDTCVGAKINGLILPLVTQLRSGDEVEILRDQNHRPPSNWIGIAATGKARAAIRRAVRLAAAQRAYALGEHVLNMMLEREGVMLDESEGKALAEALEQQSKRDLLVAVGEGKIGSEPLSVALAQIKGIRKRRRKLELPVADTADGWFALRGSDQFRFRVPGGQRSGPRAKAALAQLDFHTPVTVSGEGIVPGDRLVGILEPDNPLTVYPIHSDALTAKHDSDLAWVDVRWNLARAEEHLYPTVISMESVNRPGSLAQISSAIAACDANINNLVMRMISPDFHQMIFEIEVRDLAQLTDVLATLKRSPGLSAVQRAGLREAGMISTLEWDGSVDRSGRDG